MNITKIIEVARLMRRVRRFVAMPKVINAVRKAAGKRDKGPVWKGPTVDGVTQSLLTRYLSCKERFRIYTIEGLKPSERFNAPLDFGNMWHACEETLAAVGKSALVSDVQACQNFILNTYESDLGRKYPLQRQEIAEWANKCRELFPRYVDYWAQHPDVQDRTPLLQEASFNVPYTLPSGRVVKLRGKFDSVDLIGKGKTAGIYLQENKTKGTIDGSKINRQLGYDLQTMLYLVALITDLDRVREEGRVELTHPITGEKALLPASKMWPVLGVRYNVIRRAAHKTAASMLKKFEEDFAAGRVGEWFARWRVEVSPADIAKFKRECLDPVLENLCDDYEWWDYCKKNGANPFDESMGARQLRSLMQHGPRHFRMPYTGYNPLSEGGFGDVDEYMATGSEVGLKRVDNLFPELE